MKYDYLIFDLDGTISDPRDGIVRSINFALDSFGFEQYQEEELCKFIGPPIDETFAYLTAADDEVLINSLVAKYRERYADIGYSENSLYRGIRETLETLGSVQGLQLGICTSKRVDFAERILELFSLRQLFCFVNGGDVGIKTWQQLGSLIEQGKINHNSVMIGDRSVDIAAAKKNSLHSAGVLWGYGSHAELNRHDPSYIFSSPHELIGLAG